MNSTPERASFCRNYTTRSMAIRFAIGDEIASRPWPHFFQICVLITSSYFLRRGSRTRLGSFGGGPDRVALGRVRKAYQPLAFTTGNLSATLNLTIDRKLPCPGTVLSYLCSCPSRVLAALGVPSAGTSKGSILKVPSIIRTQQIFGCRDEVLKQQPLHG